MSYKSVYEYYQNQPVLPTHGNFKSRDELGLHEAQRRNLFLDKLNLPPRLFQGADLLEFGPDSGENALVFSRWGAQCSLAEPNGQAHPVIRQYFESFGLSQHLVSLEELSVEGYAEKHPGKDLFDFIVAEGFVYTIKPDAAWMTPFARLLKPDGFLIFYFLESAGCFFELFLKAIHARLKSLTGLSPLETSKRVFKSKWDSIPHIRTLESWTMDVMENPFIRLPYFNDTRDLCQGLRAEGLSLYSSWPPLKHNAAVYWHKTQVSNDEADQRESKFIERSRLSFFFGRTLFSHKPIPRSLIDDILTPTEHLATAFTSVEAFALQERLQVLGTFLGSENIYGDLQDQEAARSALASTTRLLGLLAAGVPEDIASFCNSDQAFIHTWGMPTHYLVFTKPSSVAN